MSFSTDFKSEILKKNIELTKLNTINIKKEYT